MSFAFQSTPPSREATPFQIRVSRHYQISIHAPLTGGDWKETADVMGYTEFQSTPPSREATWQA